MLQTLLKAAEDISPDKIYQFCAYGFLLVFNMLLRRRAITWSWSRQSHYLFTGPPLQLSLMEWQRIPKAFGSTTYNLEHLASQEVRRKHEEPVLSQDSLHSSKPSASQLQDPLTSNGARPISASSVTEEITSLVIKVMEKSDISSAIL